MLPVSYAPPCYYADQPCDRARVYIKEFYDGSLPMPRSSRIIDKVDEEKRKDIQEEKEKTRKEGIKGMRKARYADNDGNAEGSWNAMLNDTMFWM
jgi:hypothetical protein